MARKDEKIAKQARDTYSKWRTNFKRNIDQYHRFTSFVNNDQWDEDEQRLLKTYKKVPLTFNKVGALIKQLLGEQQQNTPQLEVVPQENCDYRTAKIRASMVKDISLGSDAKQVYQRAAKQSATGGFGSILVTTEYVDERSFEQKIVLRWQNDPTKCWWDLSAEHPCKIDGMHCGIESRMSRERFRAYYGRKLEKNIQNITSDDIQYNFSDDKGISIFDYWVRDYDIETIYKLDNGMTIEEEDKSMLEEVEVEGERLFAVNGEIVRIVEKRDTKRFKIKYYKIAGDYILDESDFPSEYLPLVFVDQDSYYNKAGQQITKPFVLDARDAQRYLNYLGTQSAYMLKISRYDQFLTPKSAVRSNDTQQIWRDPNSVNGALIYDDSANGAKPEQLRPPELSQSLITQYQRALDDIHTSTGMYETRLGDQGREVSGSAIDARTRQGSYNTFVFFNSINRAIACCGTIINEMIPRVYDTERVITLIDTEEGQQTITINQQMDEYGAEIANDIRKGTYLVRLQPGASYEGQKQEARDSLNLVLQAKPDVFPLIADLYAESLPLSNSIELKNRLRTIVPPEIIQAGMTGKPLPPKGNQPSPEEIQMQMQQQQMQMQAQFQQQQMQLKAEELRLKREEAEIEAEVKLAKIEEERMKVAAQLEEARWRYEAETHRTMTNQQISHADNIVDLLTKANKESHGIKERR